MNDINSHLSEGCVYESIECTNGCGEMLWRRCLTQNTATECSHRKINCPHCKLSGRHHFITGDHIDDDLAWPFRGRFDIMILNQISNNKHYSRRIVFDDRYSDDVAGRIMGDFLVHVLQLIVHSIFHPSIC